MSNNRHPIISDFLDYIENVRSYSVHTSRSYAYDLNDYVKFCNNFDYEKKFTALNQSAIQAYLQNLSVQGLSAKTLARRLSAIKSLYKYLLKNNIVKVNIAIAIKTPKISKKLPRYLSLEEAKKILRLPVGENEPALRDRLILELFYATGVRISELIKICFRDIRLEEGLIFVIGKGNKERFVIMGGKAKLTLQKYMQILNDRKERDSDSYLFPAIRKNKNGLKKHISQRTIFNIVKKYMKQISDDEKLSPHSLRHTFATHMLNNGADMMAIKDLLGHSSLSSTQIYTHLQPVKLKEIYKQAHPHGE